MNEPETQPSGGLNPFRTKQQESIFNFLNELIAPGIASLYRDLCILRNWSFPEQPIESDTILAFHLAREIESCLREVLEPENDREMRNQSYAVTLLHELESTLQLKAISLLSEIEKTLTIDLYFPSFQEIDIANSAQKRGQSYPHKSEHRNSILNILRFLDIKEDHDVSRKWTEIVGKLQIFVHRKGLSNHGQLSGEGKDLLVKLDDIFFHILTIFQKRYEDYFIIVDELLKHASPSKKDLITLKQRVPRTDPVQSYFYEKLTSVSWLVPLWKKGFFEPHDKYINGAKRPAGRFTQWPQSKYLEKMTTDNPKTVAEIYCDILPRACDSIIYSAVKAALYMTPEIASTITNRIAEL